MGSTQLKLIVIVIVIVIARIGHSPWGFSRGKLKEHEKGFIVHSLDLDPEARNLKPFRVLL